MMDKAYFLSSLAYLRTCIEDKKKYPDSLLDEYYRRLGNYPLPVWKRALNNILLSCDYRIMPLIGTFGKECETILPAYREWLKRHPELEQKMIEDEGEKVPDREEYARLMKEQLDIINRLCGKFTI